MQPLSKVELLRQRWDEYRLTKTQAFWLAAGSVVATLVVGFGMAGWVSGGSAQKMVTEAATGARHELATAICVEEFMAAADAKARLAKLGDASWYDRGEMVAQGGWATMPDRKEPNSMVATLCAGRLAELQEKSGLTPTSAAGK
ncbi:MAG TPA: hypothetical protein VFZ81_15115 [Burkholderiales bacterium]